MVSDHKVNWLLVAFCIFAVMAMVSALIVCIRTLFSRLLKVFRRRVGLSSEQRRDYSEQEGRIYDDFGLYHNGIPFIDEDTSLRSFNSNGREVLSVSIPPEEEAETVFTISGEENPPRSIASPSAPPADSPSPTEKCFDVGLDTLRCTVCMDVPTLVGPGHRGTVYCCQKCDQMVCGKCLQYLAECPSCRVDFTVEEPFRNKFAERILAEAVVNSSPICN